MSEPRVADVLVLAGDAAAARRWAGALGEAEFRVRLAGEEGDGPPDVVVLVGDAPEWSGEEAVGVVRLGSAGPADVTLPADATGRELGLACRLLAEIVRLRRQDRARAEVHDRLLEEAQTDPVTGLPNRRAWEAALRERLAAAGQADQPLALAILDLDLFKRVNDEHGHAAGDAVLRAAGGVLRKGLRTDDFVARLGGDEFGLLVNVPDAGTALAVVDRVRGALPAALEQSGSPPVTASAGLQLAQPPLPSPEALFHAADAALRQAKQQGRDRTVAGD
jgi:diguanylate cyclase (GGDEF)-like protein